MSEFEDLGSLPSRETAEKIAELADKIELDALRRTRTREQAIAYGEKLGNDTADQKGETGTDREQRIARAKAYAAWEYDGKPAGGAHLAEFGISQRQAPAGTQNGSDFKREQVKKEKQGR